jgi:NDP-sugar pyrophosphorylase family protein
MLVAREAVAALPVTVGGVAERLWSGALRQGRLGAAVVAGSWREVGDPGSYLATVLELLGSDSMVDADATVGDAAEVVRSLIGAGATVGEGAAVVESVVAAGAVVGPGAQVRGSVLLGAVEVSAGSEAENARWAVPG